MTVDSERGDTMKRVFARTMLLLLVSVAACGRGETKLTELQRQRAGEVDVVLLSPRDALRHGMDTFVLEFRSPSDGALVDVGEIRASATMPMPGAPMMAGIEVKRSETPGRYSASTQFDMAGTWRFSVEWQGPAGHGSVTFSGSVQ